MSIPDTSQTSESATLTVLADTEPPMVVDAGVHLHDATKVSIRFDEAVDQATATNPAHYSFGPTATVIGAVLGADRQTVTLTTSGIGDVAPSLTIRDVSDLVGNTMPATVVTPGWYPFGLVLWLRSDRGVAADGWGRVAAWNDQSGNNHHATQPYGMDPMPLLVPGDLNGLPVIRFNGADDFLMIDHSEAMSIVADMTVCVVARFTDFANFNGIIGKTAGPDNNLPAPCDFYTVAGSGVPRFYRGNGEPGVHAFVDAATAPTPGQAHILSVIMGGTDVAHYLDGASNGAGTLVTTMADNAQHPVGIGTRYDLVTRMKGDFAELLVFNTAISEQERLGLDAYLGARYGIAVAPPVTDVVLGAVLVEDTILITWPADATGFVLEMTDSLTEINWTPVTEPVERIEDQNTVRVSLEGGMRCFRLYRP